MIVDILYWCDVIGHLNSSVNLRSEGKSLRDRHLAKRPKLFCCMRDSEKRMLCWKICHTNYNRLRFRICTTLT